MPSSIERETFPQGKNINRIYDSLTFAESVPNTDILLTSKKIKDIGEKPFDV